MDRIFEGSLVLEQLKLLCHQAMTGEAIVNGPNYRSSLSFPIRFLKRSMFSHNYFSLLMRGVKTWRQEIRFSLMLSKKLYAAALLNKEPAGAVPHTDPKKLLNSITKCILTYDCRWLHLLLWSSLLIFSHILIWTRTLVGFTVFWARLDQCAQAGAD